MSSLFGGTNFAQGLRQAHGAATSVSAWMGDALYDALKSIMEEKRNVNIIQYIR